MTNLISSKARQFATLFSEVFNAVDSYLLALSPAHSLDSDWLAADKRLSRSLTASQTPGRYAWVCLYEIGRGISIRGWFYEMHFHFHFNSKNFDFQQIWF